MYRDGGLKDKVESTKKWLVYGNASSEYQALQQSEKIQPGEVFYCQIVGTGKSTTGFRVMAKTHDGLVETQGQPVLLSN